MKMAYNHARTKVLLDSREGQKARAAFFFHDRGSEIQKSFDGLLHSILYQLLSDLPVLLPIIVPIYQQIAEDERRWSINELERAFTEVLSQTIIEADICLFLDALDEYSGSHENVANFLNHVVNAGNEAHTRIKICFSSRPLQIFLDRFSNTTGFDLHKWTAGDIELVIKSRMSDNTRMHQYMHSSAAKDRELALQFADKIASGAQGVFLWVRLVLDELLDAFTHGERLVSLIHRLADLPTELEAYYERILNRLPSSYHMEALVMFKTLETSIWTPLIHDFIHVCDYAETPKLANCTPCDPSSLEWTDEELLRRLRTRSGGLIEAIPQNPGHGEPLCPYATKLPGLKVQFIHQTVKSFIQRPRILGLLSNAQSLDFCDGAFLGVKYILALTFDYTSSNKAVFLLRKQLLVRLLHHCTILAEATSSILCADILEECGDTKISWLFGGQVRYGGSVFGPHEGLLSFAVAAGTPHLLKELLDRNRPTKNLRVPLLHLAVHLRRSMRPGRIKEIIQILLEHGADVNVLYRGLTPFQDLLQNDNDPSFSRHEIIRQLLIFGQDPNQMIKYKIGRGTLFCITSSGPGERTCFSQTFTCTQCKREPS
jgi:hypothetical protein